MRVAGCIFLGVAFLLAGPSACGKKLPPPVIAEVAVAPPAPPPPPPGPTLYERLGGKTGLAEVIDTFVSNIQADKRINKTFAKTTGPKLEHFTQMLADQLCSVAGGGCSYSGKPMGEAHTGMKITDAQFEAFLQDLSLALEEKQVPKDAEKELIDKFAALHDDILGTAASETPAPAAKTP
jgi:hemoglobin